MQNRGPQLAGTCASLLALSIVAVSVRCYVRLILTKSFKYDDCLLLATLVRTSVVGLLRQKVSNQPQVFYALFCTVVLVGIHHGTGQHTVDLTPHNISIAMKVSFYSSSYHNLALTWGFPRCGGSAKYSTASHPPSPDSPQARFCFA